MLPNNNIIIINKNNGQFISYDDTVTSQLQAWIASPPERALSSEKEAPEIVSALLVVEIVPPTLTAELCLKLMRLELERFWLLIVM